MTFEIMIDSGALIRYQWDDACYSWYAYAFGRFVYMSIENCWKFSHVDRCINKADWRCSARILSYSDFSCRCTQWESNHLVLDVVLIIKHLQVIGEWDHLPWTRTLLQFNAGFQRCIILEVEIADLKNLLTFMWPGTKKIQTNAFWNRLGRTMIQLIIWKN